MCACVSVCVCDLSLGVELVPTTLAPHSLIVSNIINIM